jgi:hypothetical protein
LKYRISFIIVNPLSDMREDQPSIRALLANGVHRDKEIQLQLKTYPM